MGQCKYCKKKGLFLFTDGYGLCKPCRAGIHGEVVSRGKVIADSLKLAQEGKTFKTRLSRCDLLIEHAEALTKFEKLGIDTLETPPSELILHFIELRDELILDEIKAVTEKAIVKWEIASTLRSKLSPLEKALLKIRELSNELDKEKMAENSEKKIRSLIHQTNLDGFLETAKKAEFKGNMKKAVDGYQEALYFIENDDIEDEVQKKEIRDIKAKIEELTSEGLK